MSDTQTQAEILPAVRIIKIPKSGEPYLEGYQCQACQAVFTDERKHCASCGARDSIAPLQLANKGTLTTYSIVYRSYPGVEVPFISAVVDLQGGGTLRGNLINVEPDPENIHFGMPLQVVFADALGRKDKKGNRYLSYFFTPAQQ